MCVEKVRLNKFLRDAGVASRRKVEKLIIAGAVSINKITVKELGTLVERDDLVEVHGKKVNPIQTFITYKFHKPKGFLCSHKKHPGEKIIYDLFPKRGSLFSIGRLDKDTTGLLLVTNDGTFANDVIHPSGDITKEYIATTKEKISPVHLRRISAGCSVEGVHIIPHRVEKIGPSEIKVIVKEGKKREVRLLLQNAGLSVEALIRTKIGGLELGNLPEGSFIPLTESDRAKIFVGKN